MEIHMCHGKSRGINFDLGSSVGTLKISSWDQGTIHIQTSSADSEMLNVTFTEIEMRRVLKW